MTTTTSTRGTSLRTITTATATLIALLCLEGAAWAQDGGCLSSRGYASLEDKLQGRALGCSSAPRASGSSGSYQAASILGAFVDVVDLGDLELQLDGAEVQAADGAFLPALGTGVVGGVQLGVGGRLHRWIRLPEFTLTLGGASFEDGAWAELGSQHRGLAAQVTSLFLLRAELALGVEAPFRHVRPYLLGRAAASLFVVGADLRDERLGDLGHETVADGAIELGSEVGLSFLLTDQLALNVGWRATWLGATGHGVAITLTGGSSLR